MNNIQAAGGKKSRSIKREGGQQNGKSWAFELGNEQQICPIIVEDLQYPGHMLIEVSLLHFHEQTT